MSQLQSWHCGHTSFLGALLLLKYEVCCGFLSCGQITNKYKDTVSESVLQMFDFRNLQNGIQDQLNFNLQLQNINMSSMKLF